MDKRVRIILLYSVFMQKGRLFFEDIIPRSGYYCRGILFIFLLITVSSCRPDKYISEPLLTTESISGTNAFFFRLLLISIILSSVVIFFIAIKQRRLNRQLIVREKEISDLNIDLQKANKELLSQRDLISKEYSESDKFYQMLIQSADDGISFFDRNWTLKYANQAFYTLIGMNSLEYSTTKYEDIVHPEDINYQAERIKKLNETGFFETELRLRHANGQYLNLSSRSVTVKNDSGEILGSLTISRDITKLKQVHEDFKKATVEAETSNRLKTSFLANISHEIRTPLNSVVGFSNLLLADDISRKVKEEYIEHINYNSEKLLQIIGDIIDLSRLESSQIEITYEETSLNSIISELIEEARQVIIRNEKSIILNVRNQFEDNGDLIFTDRIWLKRVLNHLLDNAVKFTLDGSIEFSYFKENENLVFKIKDTGIGINKENLDHIFKEFRQEIDGHHRPFEGLGIGLTLAKEVVERMGGKIYVQSEKGIGSEFSFSIPYRPAGSIRSRLKSVGSDIFSGPINWSSRKCLLVDDNKDVLLYLTRILNDTGITILTARSGYEAIETIRSHSDIDVVLLDMQMPEMNGIEATKEIRMISRNLPIIAQTAFIFEDDKDIIIEAGCDACLFKPIRREHLLTVMAGFIKAN
jgi:PAS domain S-box-containing protein